MSFEQERQNWRDEVDRPLTPAEVRQGLVVVQERYDKLERAVHRRDLREILTVVFVVAALAAMWPLYRASLVAGLGVAVMVLGGAVAPFVLLSARKPAPLPFDASVLDFSRQRLAWLDAQIRLLETVAWWYVSPAFVGSLLFIWGGLNPIWGVNPGGWLFFGLFFGLFALIDVAVAAWLVDVNKRAVRDELLPVREDLARLIESLGPADQT